MNLHRRQLPALAAAAGMALPLGVRAQSLLTDAGGQPLNVPPRRPKARVVAVGGGMAGATCATTQPKAGHMAKQEAKVCAYALARIFGGGQPDPQPTTNSACCSTITADQAAWLTVVFQYDPITQTMVPAPGASAASVGSSEENFRQMEKWFRHLMADTFE